MFLALFLVFSAASVFADPVKVNLGDSVLLESQAPRDAAIRLLEWIRPDLKSDGDVFFYRNERSYAKYQHPSYRGRVELKDPELKDGDVSVVLKNVSMNDTGTYECRIVVTITGGNTGTSSEQWHHVDLEVLGPGTVNKVIKEREPQIRFNVGVGLSVAFLATCEIRSTSGPQTEEILPPCTRIILSCEYE